VADLCRGQAPNCGHGDPPSDPTSQAHWILEAAEAGEAVVVSVWIAQGHRWQGHSWSGPEFDLPWGPGVRKVRIMSDDLVEPVGQFRPSSTCPLESRNSMSERSGCAFGGVIVGSRRVDPNVG
jgi:hypothetical protein